MWYINDIHFNFYSYYMYLKVFTEKNVGDKDILIEKIKFTMSKLITLAEKVIRVYNEFLNGTKTEEVLMDDMDLITPSIEKYYFEEIKLAIPPFKIRANAVQIYLEQYMTLLTITIKSKF